MAAMSTLVNILGLTIILISVLCVLVRKENSVFGHAQNRDACSR